MAPPTFTPSPHRFLTQPRAPPSSLRTVQRPTATTSSSSQFAPTPRFSLSSTRAEQSDDVILPSSSPPASTSPLVSRRRPHVRLRRGEEIEDSDQEEEIGRARHKRERASADRDGERQADDEDELRAARRHKRRRLSIESWDHEGPEFVHGGQSTTKRQREVIAISSSPPSSRSSSPPPSPSPSASNTAKPQQNTISPNPSLSLSLPTTTTTTSPPPPRFLLPLPTPSFSFPLPPTTLQTAPSPTLFLLPPAQPPSPTSHDPLPELFSPHRRGQKFLPDGLAATVRDWVVEVGSRSRSHRGGRGRGLRHGDWEERRGGGEGEDEVRMRVLEVWGDGNLVLVRGTLGLGNGEEGGRKWMLMGAGGRGAQVQTGMVVVVRAPVWEVEVRGERWGVGVEWRVGGAGG